MHVVKHAPLARENIHNPPVVCALLPKCSPIVNTICAYFTSFSYLLLFILPRPLVLSETPLPPTVPSQPTSLLSPLLSKTAPLSAYLSAPIISKLQSCSDFHFSCLTASLNVLHCPQFAVKCLARLPSF